MQQVQKKMQTLVEESYGHEESKFDASVIAFFEKERTSIEEGTIYLHLKGANEDLMNTYYKDPKNKGKIVRLDYKGSPFKETQLKKLPGKIPRLDQLPLF